VDVCLFQTAVYNLKIVAVDGGMPALTSTADVTVELLDVNDSPPQFTNDNFTATLEVSQSQVSCTRHTCDVHSAYACVCVDRMSFTSDKYSSNCLCLFVYSFAITFAHLM